MKKNAKIYIAGARTVMGTALRRRLQQLGYSNVLNASGDEPDFTDLDGIDAYFKRMKPQYVFLTGAKSGGILANQKFPADLMLSNLLAECHLLSCAFRHGVEKLLHLASSCVYPRLCSQPMQVSSLLTGPLEPTSEPYSIAKIAGIKLCESFRRQHDACFTSAIIADAFGPDDSFDLENSHVIGALIRKMHEAKELGLAQVEVWGSGNPRREFSFSDDLADACVFVLCRYEGGEPINVGTGADVSVREIAEMIRQTVGYRGELAFNTSKPDGMPVKVLDTTALKAMGWRPQTELRAAIAATYEGFLRSTQTKGTPSGRPILQNL